MPTGQIAMTDMLYQLRVNSGGPYSYGGADIFW